MHPRILLLASLAASVLANGCAQEDQGARTTWAQLQVETLNLELIDPDKYELLMFAPAGMVSATVGTKGGGLIGPLWYWRLEGDHLIVSEKLNADTYADLHEPRLLQDRLFVKRGLLGNAKYSVRRRQ